MTRPVWTSSEEIHYSLEVQTQRWRLHITGIKQGGRSSSSATVSLWLVRQEHEYNCFNVVADRPIAVWHQVWGDNEAELRRKAEEIATDFIKTLADGWPP